MPFHLDAANAVPYLVGRGLIAPEVAPTAVAATLGGGVSNTVIRVDIPGAPEGTPARTLALKQSLPKLRVAGDWFADRERIYRECAAINYLAGQLPPSSVPQIVCEDQDNFLFAMTAAPPDGVNWKDALLAGHIDAAVAGQVGRLLGEMHRRSAIAGGRIPPDLQQFADQHCFVQLRIDPYHRAAAAAHPDLAGAIEAEAQRMLNRRQALVHGDYSPKNIIVSGAGAAAGAFLLDFEVVHLGSPVFDLAFMLNHLTLKAVHRPELAGQYNDAARAFRAAYLATAGAVARAAVGPARDTMRQLAVLLLARVDGKSPVEYIVSDAQRRRVRRIARSILSGELASLDDLHCRLADGSGRACRT